VTFAVGSAALDAAARETVSQAAASDPANAGWRRDLSVSHLKVGEVRRDQGDLAGALAAYEAGLAIREELAASDPANAGWQRGLIVAHTTLAFVAVDLGRIEAARRRYAAAIQIADDLAATGRLSPSDASMPEALREWRDSLPDD
jgi:tetratricopeptide (TPR) repeat protein